MSFNVRSKFRSVHRPLSEDEERELLEDLRQRGILDPVKIYNDTDDVIDGHNRLRLAPKAGIKESDIPWERVYFESESQAIEWIIRQQLGRRNVKPSDYKLLLGRLYKARKGTRGGARGSKGQNDPLKKSDENEPENERNPPECVDAADQIAEEFGVSASTVKRSEKLSEDYEKLASAAKKLYDAGKLTEAQVGQMAKLSKEKQTEAARRIRTGQITAASYFKSRAAKPAKPSRPFWQIAAEKHDAALNHLTQVTKLMNEIASSGKQAEYLAPSITRIQMEIKELRSKISGLKPIGLKAGKIQTSLQRRRA